MKIQAFQQIESTLTENGTRLVFIGSSSPKQTTEFLEIATVRVSKDLYSDPQVGLYKLFALKSGRFRSLVMPIFSGLKKYGFKGVKEGTYIRHIYYVNLPFLTFCVQVDILNMQMVYPQI